MFKQLSTKSGSYNDLLDLEEAIRVEEEDLERQCCCFKHNYKQSKGDQDPRHIVRYYKKASLSLTDEDGVTRAVTSQSELHEQMFRPLLDERHDDNDDHSHKCEENDGCGDEVTSSLNRLSLKQKEDVTTDDSIHYSLPEDDTYDTENGFSIIKNWNDCTTTPIVYNVNQIASVKSPIFEMINTPKIQTQEPSEDQNSPTSSSQLDLSESSTHFVYPQFETSPKSNRSQSLQVSLRSSSGLEKEYSSNPSSPVLSVRSTSCYNASQQLPPSLRSFHPNHFQQYVESSSSQILQPRKPSNASTISEYSTISSTSTAATVIVPGTRLFPTNELPPIGRMRRVFTTHVRRRKKKKPPVISFHLTNFMKEPLRVVHSVPLSFPPG